MSISELTLAGKPSILVPSPNVSEDHQTKNAMFLVNKSAAILVEDKHTDSLLRTALDLLKQENQLNTISKNAKKMGSLMLVMILSRKYLNLFLNEFR